MQIKVAVEGTTTPIVLSGGWARFMCENQTQTDSSVRRRLRQGAGRRKQTRTRPDGASHLHLHSHWTFASSSYATNANTGTALVSLREPASKLVSLLVGLVALGNCSRERASHISFNLLIFQWSAWRGRRTPQSHTSQGVVKRALLKVARLPLSLAQFNLRVRSDHS